MRVFLSTAARLIPRITWIPNLSPMLCTLSATCLNPCPFLDEGHRWGSGCGLPYLSTKSFPLVVDAVPSFSRYHKKSTTTYCSSLQQCWDIRLKNSSSKLIWSDLAPPNLSSFSCSITCFADQHIFCLQIDTYLIAKWDQLLSHNLCILEKHLLWYDPRESIIWVPSSWWGCGYIRTAVYNMVAMHAAHATKRWAKEKPHATADKKIKWYITDTRACCTWNPNGSNSKNLLNSSQLLQEHRARETEICTL